MTLTASLVDAASRPYLRAGRFAYHFARGKLRHDPVFEAILARGWLSERRSILDLGSGQGLLAALLRAARAAAERGDWPAAWPPPPRPTRIRCIELTTRGVTRARDAFATDAFANDAPDRIDLVQADVREVAFGSADGVVLLDVLHYLRPAEQRLVLERARAALPHDGLLILRIGDAAGGLGFRLSEWIDRCVLGAGGGGTGALHGRPLAEWCALLGTVGFECETVPMSAGTPFANVLITARPR